MNKRIENLNLIKEFIYEIEEKYNDLYQRTFNEYKNMKNPNINSLIKNNDIVDGIINELKNGRSNLAWLYNEFKTKEKLKDKLWNFLSNYIFVKKAFIFFSTQLVDNKMSFIIGKNGVGKTRWLNSLEIGKNVVKILANREVWIVKETNSERAKLNSRNIERSSSFWNSHIHKMIVKYHDKKNERNSNDDFEKLITEFKMVNSNYELKKDMFSEEVQWLNYKILSKKISPLGLENLSEGEKHLLYMLIHVIFAPKNAFVLIDEPEMGLNEEKLSSFFNDLRTKRPDLKFIIITHSEKLVKIAITQKQSNLYWFKDIIDNNPLIDELNEKLDISLYFSILANPEEKTNILLVEGEYDSFDYHLYKIFYPNYQIVPNGGKDELIGTAEIMKKSNLFKDKNIKVLRDRDEIRSKDEEDKLNKKQVFLTKLWELEEIFYVKEFLVEYYDFLRRQIRTKLNIEQINGKINDIDNIIKNKGYFTGIKKNDKNPKKKKINQVIFKYEDKTFKEILNTIEENQKLQEIIKEKLLPNNLE